MSFLRPIVPVLLAAPLAAAQGHRLTGPPLPGVAGDVTGCALASDGTTVVYRADHDLDEVFEPCALARAVEVSFPSGPVRSAGSCTSRTRRRTTSSSSTRAACPAPASPPAHRRERRARVPPEPRLSFLRGGDFPGAVGRHPGMQFRQRTLLERERSP
jgi:hypothetical protein